MSFLQYILFIVILINPISTSTIHIELTTTQSINEITSGEILKLQNDLNRDEEQLRIDREIFEENKKELEKSIKKTDVIRLNVGGEIIMTTRQTLTRIPKSILSLMFNGRWDHQLPTDQNENIFLDFNPIVFRRLLDQLQLFDANHLIQFSPPSEPSLLIAFQKMIRKLGLNQFLSLEKNIISFNVGGQIITNRRTIFNQISNSTFDTILRPSQTTKFDNKSDEFVDYDPKLFRHLVNQLREESFKIKSCFKAPSSTSYRENISFKKMLNDLSIFSFLCIPNIAVNAKWIQNGITVAGGNREGNGLNQLYNPWGIYVNDDQTIYVAEQSNHRIVEWRSGATSGQVVAGGNGAGNRNDQFNDPRSVIVDKDNDCLIICDYGNKRVVRWPRRNSTSGQTIIANISCRGLAMDKNRYLYVSDDNNHEVRRWKMGETSGTVVAGGNGAGSRLDQLNQPHFIFIDQYHSVYVSDRENHRVMKWVKGVKEGVVVAGGYGQGNGLTQLSYPYGVTVDQLSTVYVANWFNDRVMRWPKGATQGSVVVGGNGEGEQANQFNGPVGLSFDRWNNLYIVDNQNHRVQKFNIEPNSNL